MNYGLIDRAANLNAEGIGIGGGIGQGPDGYEGHVTFYVEVADVEDALQKAESLGGTRVMGPEKIMEGVELGQFTDPEGNVIGLIKSAA
jgi:predicted enzyme related to lactoylglutathione lyase